MSLNCGKYRTPSLDAGYTIFPCCTVAAWVHSHLLNELGSTTSCEANKKVQVGKDQEKAQSERDSHSKNRDGKKQTNNQALIP